MIRELFKIEDEDYNRELDGFLQILSTISRHDKNRAAIHIPTKIWHFYKLDQICGRKPKVWIRDQNDNYFVNCEWGNLYGIKSKYSGRLMIDLSLIPEEFIGKVVEVTIRYRKPKLNGADSHSLTAPSMIRKIN